MRKQGLDTDAEYKIQNPNENTDQDDAGDNNQRVVDRLLAGRPDDLAALAFQLAEPFGDTRKETGLLCLDFFRDM